VIRVLLHVEVRRPRSPVGTAKHLLSLAPTVSPGIGFPEEHYSHIALVASGASVSAPFSPICAHVVISVLHVGFRV
jgi:hypothetical protein